MPNRYPAKGEVDPAPLGEPLHLAFSGRTAKNRLIKASTSEHMSSWSPDEPSKRGTPTKELINLYRHYGAAGWGIILTGDVLIHPEHLEAAGNTIITPGAPFEGPRFDTFAKLATEAKAGGSLVIAQVLHPGRLAVPELQADPVSASDIQLVKSVGEVKYNKPHAASEQEIRELQAAFVHSAVYLERAGFDGIEINAAHGHLLAQFLSASTNRRTDLYGGSPANRARFLYEVIDGVCAARSSPAFVVAVKLNSVEFQDRGMTTDEAAQLAHMLEQQGVDLVELTGGTYEDPAWHHRRDTTRVREAFFLEFAAGIAPRLRKTRSVVTGGLRSVAAMVGALDTVDAVALARPACAEPRLPLDILAGRVKACCQAGGGGRSGLCDDDAHGRRAADADRA
ncbi:Uu.00g086480.m01.CDS01 [Anthostomella pinea]|uniref:Uu.00g086480.m01.CDS01 n=1 Tax=Anthostomella pinea TaxID=933095 RepID=A0AAI8VMS4_9PEZI|nr:Uu.00g086480.m01.CDS01 [Anthostomella pinea]